MKPDAATYYSIDENLYQGIKEGDGDALEFLYRTIFPSFRNFVIKSNGSEQDAQDCFQDAVKDFYYNVCTGRHQTGRAKASVALFNYAKLNFYSLLKSAGKRYTSSMSETFDTASGDDFLETTMKAELLAQVQRALRILPERCRLIIEWFYFESQSFREIGQRLGMTEDSAKNRRFRCIGELKQLLKSVI